MFHASSPDEHLAEVRFLNNTPAGATMRADGRALTGADEAGAITSWLPVGAGKVALSLDPTGEPSALLERFEEGGRYTVTARGVLHDVATLRVTREAGTMPSLAGHR